MTEPEADLGADSPPPVDVTVAGGHFGHAVVGTQIVNSNTVVYQHGVDVDASALPTGHFRLNPKITVSEIDPINRDSRIYHAKLHSEILGDVEIAVKILSDGMNMTLDGLKIPNANAAKRLLKSLLRQNPAERPSALNVLRDRVFEGPRLQSDSAAMHIGLTYERVQGFAAIGSKGTPAPSQKRKSFFGKLWKTSDRKFDVAEENPYSFGDAEEEVVVFAGGAEEVYATPGGPTEHKLTNIVDLRRDLQRHGIAIDVQRFLCDFDLGIEWEGQYRQQKVVIAQYIKHDWQEYENAVSALSELEHENIVHFIKEVPDVSVIITEFHDRTLHQYLQGDGQRVELSDLFRMAAQVATGMNFLHGKKYIHCGLCAGNVVVVANSLCKISGFNEIQHENFEKFHRPKPNFFRYKWAAPEVLCYDCYSFKSDVWSFGVLLWEIVTGGRTPYPGLANRDVEAQLFRGYRMRKPELCPSGLYFDIMMPCWDKDPDARPTFADLEKTFLLCDVEADEKRGNTLDVKRNLKKYGITVGSFKRDFLFGKEWEGRFSDRKVTIMQFNEGGAEKYGNAVDVLTDLKHENIVLFIKHVPDIYVIITEVCELTLKEYLQGDGERAKLNDLLRMAAQIAPGMDFLHRKNYIHCDLRAANVIVGPNLLIKISGLSLAQHVKMTRCLVLPPDTSLLVRWAAQEAFEGGRISFKTDVWSFGVVLWEIVTRGQTPYPGVPDEIVDRSICAGHRMLRPKQCQSGLYFDIMMPCWNEDPDARPTFECLEKSLLSYDVEADEKEESVTVRALFDYTTVKETELSFKKGDIIVDCTVSSDVGWSWGTLDGKMGYVPTNYVVQIKSQGT